MEESSPKYVIEAIFHNRETNEVVGREIIEGWAQGYVLAKLWHITGKYGHKFHYLVVDTSKCRVRPVFLIKNLKSRGIQVIEPRQYPNGQRGQQQIWD